MDEPMPLGEALEMVDGFSTAVRAMYGLMEQARKDAAIKSGFELAMGIASIAHASAMDNGPMAKSGARSHRAWRTCVAWEDRWRAVKQISAACMYAAASRPREADDAEQV